MGAPTYEQLRVEVKELRLQHDADTEALAELEQTLAKLETLQKEHAELQSQVEALRYNLANVKRREIREKQLAYARGVQEGKGR